jgi:hypothetical protein
MPSSDTRRVLKTIAYHIELARRFVDGMSYDDLMILLQTSVPAMR